MYKYANWMKEESKIGRQYDTILSRGTMKSSKTRAQVQSLNVIFLPLSLSLLRQFPAIKFAIVCILHVFSFGNKTFRQ